ncbi:MAG TPA: class I SAM-dependent methyltransferase [Burkholderiaceae bacterium]|nr:class I SAM-dependent methyltransferase [Burkholderiaceae bacterium]
MTGHHAPLVSNELDALAAMLPLQHLAQHNAAVRVIELGCGNARLVREMLELGLARDVTALETDTRQHAANVAKPTSNLTFLLASAAAVPCGDASFDLALMLKSLHHVPMHQMGLALNEVARVLKPGGWFYVSEPVYDGALNDIVKLFNDEYLVRMSAQLALDEALDRHDSPWKSLQEERFDMPARFADWADFETRMLYPTFANHQIDGQKLATIREAFDRYAAQHGSASGVRFTRPMHVRLLQKVA